MVCFEDMDLDLRLELVRNNIDCFRLVKFVEYNSSMFGIELNYKIFLKDYGYVFGIIKNGYEICLKYVLFFFELEECEGILINYMYW